jgi:glucuronyl/N-acetylglucosaminyl transferase EXT2
MLGEGDLSSILKVAEGISEQRRIEMRNQGLWIYSKYFSSMEAITLTVLEILNGRVYPQHALVYNDWNEPPFLVSDFIFPDYIVLFFLSG